MKRLFCVLMAVVMMMTGMAAFAESEEMRGGMGGPNGEPAAAVWVAADRRTSPPTLSCRR